MVSLNPMSVVDDQEVLGEVSHLMSEPFVVHGRVEEIQEAVSAGILTREEAGPLINATARFQRAPHEIRVMVVMSLHRIRALKTGEGLTPK